MMVEKNRELKNQQEMITLGNKQYGIALHLLKLISLSITS